MTGILFIATICISSTVSPQHTSQLSGNLQQLAEWMTGSFTSEEQAAEDTDYVSVQIKMVRIWHDRKDGYWIYVEQAVAWSLDKPYRQRIYRITQLTDDLFLSRVYAIEEPLRFAGTWQYEHPLSQLTPDSLQRKYGCGIVLRRMSDGTFMGSTVGKDCVTTLRGAQYATAEVLINKTTMITWDRGFDENNQQVWGAEKGGYVFKKIENYPLD